MIFFTIHDYFCLLCYLCRRIQCLFILDAPYAVQSIISSQINLQSIPPSLRPTFYNHRHFNRTPIYLNIINKYFFCVVLKSNLTHYAFLSRTKDMIFFEMALFSFPHTAWEPLTTADVTTAILRRMC